MKNVKAQQRDKLIMELGVLIQPFSELLESKDLPNIGRYRVACAKIQSGDAAWRKTARELATFANDIFMNAEFQKISHVNEGFLREVGDYINEAEKTSDLAELKTRCNEAFDNLKKSFYELLEHIPVEWEPEIFPANTPFTSYLRIKETLSTPKTRIHYFDRYLKVEFFHLFLKDVSRGMEVRLVTTQGNSQYGVNGVTYVSELVRKEFKNYQLIEVTPHDIHDRNLRVDDQIFSLGPGIDRAGMALTNFGPSDSSINAHKELDVIMSKGNVIHQS